MTKKNSVHFVPCLALLMGLPAYAQQAQPPKQPPVTTTAVPDNPQSTAHMEAAKRMTGGDHVLTTVWNFFCTPTEVNAPQPALEPTKVFDNLYILPSASFQQTTVWAITTRDGIILLDSGTDGDLPAGPKTAANLEKVGLNPADVKYILLGHGHRDHYAGALYFQERYGTRVGVSAKDWNLIYPANPPATPPTNAGNLNASSPPKRDLELKEGAPIRLGEQVVNIVEIPGHTPGSLAFIFKVRERGQTHTAGMVGGTALGLWPVPIDGLKQYIASIAHYLEVARKMKVDVEIQNHALFDDTPGRLAKLKTRKVGEPNPFLMPTKKYVAFWNIIAECALADIARRPPGSK